jgi:hypothetical protein
MHEVGDVMDVVRDVICDPNVPRNQKRIMVKRSRRHRTLWRSVNVA